MEDEENDPTPPPIEPDPLLTSYEERGLDVSDCTKSPIIDEGE